MWVLLLCFFEDERGSPYREGTMDEFPESDEVFFGCGNNTFFQLGLGNVLERK